MDKHCKYPDCNNQGKISRGYCTKHYRRFWKYGDASIVFPPAKKHGLSKKHPLYSTWKNMRGRCNNPNIPNYKDYGGRGIRVCERWNDFNLFLEDMGEKPTTKHTLERIDNDGNYKPSNCKWATYSDQMKNQRHPSVSGLKGIYWYPRIKRWIARSDKDTGTKHIGTFKTKEEALNSQKLWMMCYKRPLDKY